MRSLEQHQRPALLKSTLEEMRSTFELNKKAYESSKGRGDVFEQAGLLGVVYETEARIRWLEEILQLPQFGDHQ